MADDPPALPVVCLPGIRGDARIFGPLAQHVGPAVPLVPLDLPPGAPALAAARLRDRLPPGRFRVLTGSYGGLVARFLPAHRIAHLACVATLPSPAFLQPATVRRARALMALPDPLFAQAYRWHGGRSLRDEGVPPAVVAALLSRPLPTPVVRARLRAVLDGHHGRWPAVPTLWLQGRHDPQVTWTATDLPGAHLRRVDGGHFPHASHPASVWAALASAGWTTGDGNPGRQVRGDG